jgi:hypothetical protein
MHPKGHIRLCIHDVGELDAIIKLLPLLVRIVHCNFISCGTCVIGKAAHITRPIGSSSAY